MKKEKKYNLIGKNEIDKMNYTDFIAFIQETNRCPGGKDTIRRIKNIINIDKDSNILDVGSNTGFNSIEMAHITKAKIFGIDISERCVSESIRRLNEDTEDVKNRVLFKVGSAYDIPFPENYFDFIFANGATAFMLDKEKAIEEYRRVLKPWGFICITPLVYNSIPPRELVNRLKAVLGFKIEVMNLENWVKLFTYNNKNLETYYIEENKIKNRSNDEVDEYINYFLNKPHIEKLNSVTKNAIMKKWKNYIEVFNENHKYLAYGMVFFREGKYKEEPELFKIN